MSTYGAHTDLVRRRRWLKRYRYDVVRGISHTPVDAQPVREHVRWLLGAGFTATSIARAAGVPHDTVLGVAYGYAKNREPGRERLHRSTAAKLRRVTPQRCIELSAPHQLVPKTGAARRVQALQALGWSVPLIAEAAGVSFHRARTVLYERQRSNGEPERIARGLHDAICAAYDKLSLTPGPSGHARTVAQRKGYAPPLAWDDDALDDPSAQPELGRRTWAEANGLLDREDLLWLIESGVRNWRQLEDRTGVERESLRRTLRERAGRLDLVDMLDLNTYNERRSA